MAPEPLPDVLDELHHWFSWCKEQQANAQRQARRPDHNGPGPSGQPALRWAGQALAFGAMARALENRIVELEDGLGVEDKGDDHE